MPASDCGNGFEHPSYYPAFLNLQGKKCLVVGGGNVAARKAASLVRAGAAVTVVSPSFGSRMLKMKSVRRMKRSFRTSDLRGISLVIGATNDKSTNERVAQYATEGGIPVNIVDQPDLCSFIVPSVLNRGSMTIAVSTGGASPSLAKRIRKQLDGQYSNGYAGYVSALRKLREELKTASLKTPDRQRILQKLASEQGYGIYDKGGLPALRRAAREN